VVVDSDRHVLGVISDAELLQRVTPALHPVVAVSHKLVVVVDGEGRRLGAVDRADLLRGLVAPANPAPETAGVPTRP
jgi:CBS-domain-containing membrane protein